MMTDVVAVDPTEEHGRLLPYVDLGVPTSEGAAVPTAFRVFLRLEVPRCLLLFRLRSLRDLVCAV